MGFGKTENDYDGYQSKNIIMSLENFSKINRMVKRRFDNLNFLTMLTEKSFFKVLRY